MIGNKFTGRHFLGAALLLISSLAMAQDPPVISDPDELRELKSGDVDGLIQAVLEANENPDKLFNVTINPDDNGDYQPFVFDSDYELSGNALPILTGKMIVENDSKDREVEFIGNGKFRLVKLLGASAFLISDAVIKGFGTDGEGGVALVGGSAILHFGNCLVLNNSASSNGGVALLFDAASVNIFQSTFRGNSSGGFGGVFSLQTDTSKVRVDDTYDRNHFFNNQAVSGCDIDIFTEVNTVTFIQNNLFESDCGNEIINQETGVVRYAYNTVAGPDSPLISAQRSFHMLGNILFGANTPENTNKVAPTVPGQKRKYSNAANDNCQDFDTGAFDSLGYNISTDSSCALDQDTDLPDTDPMIMENDDGLLVPLPGSPAIDSGATDVIVFEGDDLATLPCGYVDLSGTGRPQDANGDGIFECDRGAMEVQGAGEIVAGHSAAFFNTQRNGEGNFVEVLDSNRAIVYTFTYRPDGSGPAWFVGVGDINGNSIVIDELLRPVGTSFGDDFDKDKVERTPIGGMSMVFPDCKAADPGGNVTYSGDVELGYEGLISKATRLTNVTGCGVLTPNPKAGLSGSFYSPERDGEGVIVQWLPNGQILAIFFTYDHNDNQFWVLGQAAADGNTVTMDVLYPSTHTSWGRGFAADDITLSEWGTFTLTWTDCNALTFTYTSSVEGFGSATRSYIRLSALSGTACPDF